MDVLGFWRDLAWLPAPNEVHVHLTDELPPLPLITSAFALAFDGDRLLMTELRERGWDIPGGHVEVGEGPEQTMRREVSEETGARLGPARLFACQRVRLLGPAPAGYRYPCPESYQIFYVAQVVAFDPFRATDEAARRGLFSPGEALRLPWVRANEALYLAARALVSSKTEGEPTCRNGSTSPYRQSGH